jgi:hypothetical protein
MSPYFWIHLEQHQADKHVYKLLYYKNNGYLYDFPGNYGFISVCWGNMTRFIVYCYDDGTIQMMMIGWRQFNSFMLLLLSNVLFFF